MLGLFHTDSSMFVMTASTMTSMSQWVNLSLLQGATTPFMQITVTHNACLLLGYKIKLIMPADQSEERKAAMAAFGAELISVPSSSDGGGMEAARDMASRMQVRAPLQVCLFHQILMPWLTVICTRFSQTPSPHLSVHSKHERCCYWTREGVRMW